MGEAASWLVALQAASTAFGSIMQANAGKKQYEAVAEAAEYNSEVAKFDLLNTVTTKQRQKRVKRGEIVVEAGKSGLLMSGTKLDYLSQTMGEMEREILNAGEATRQEQTLLAQRAEVARGTGRELYYANLVRGVGQVAGLGASLIRNP